MSNTVTLEPTKFENVRTGEVTYGYRMYDSYESVYCNTWESIGDCDLDVLADAIEEASPAAKVMLEHVKDNETGMYICGEWYEWNEIKHMF